MYRYKIVSPIILFTLVLTQVHAQPKIQFEKEAINFGTVNPGEKLEHKFQITNTGTSELIIKDVKSSCECAVGEILKKPILPNSKADFTATMSVGSEPGEKTENIFIYSNDPNRSIIELTLTAFVKSDILIEPPYIDFGSLIYGTTPNVIVTLKDPVRKQLKINQLEIKIQGIQSSILTTSDSKPGEVQISISINTTIHMGRFDGKIIAKTDHPTQPNIEIPVRGEIKGEFTYTPERFYFGIVKKGNPITRTVTLTQSQGHPFIIKSIKSSIPAIQLKTESIDTGKRVKIHATLDTTKADGQLQGNVNIDTDSKIQPSLQIPIFGWVR